MVRRDPPKIRRRSARDHQKAPQAPSYIDRAVSAAKRFVGSAQSDPLVIKMVTARFRSGSEAERPDCRILN